VIYYTGEPDGAVRGTLTAKVKKKARELGFDAVGIAPAVPLGLAERAIRERVESGRLRNYGFARTPHERFTRPDLALPGARSLIVVALSYLRPGPADEGGGPRGRIARFALGRDYHTVVESRLRGLAEWLSREAGGANYRICVDTGPMIDRAAAREAGIGSYGRNAAIITLEAGSWVVLGELITDLALEPDDPAPLEECGDCSICLSACPSGAIVSPFVIDQTRCISHITQMKGFIPRELRPLVGDRIYGCDACQEVCPKNVGVRPGKHAPASDYLGPRPELVPLLGMDQATFDELVGPTAIGWIGRTSFRRNAAVALGNIGDPAAVPELCRALEDAEPVIRGHAAWALGKIGGVEARRVLQAALQREQDRRVAQELEAAGAGAP
jgi:epoxyqueuosine reductase